MTAQGFAAAVTVVFLLILGVIAVSVARSVLRLRRNSTAPEQAVEAVVEAKRTERRTHPGAPRKKTVHATVCYAAFRTGEGQQVELTVPPEVYERLREGDRGTLAVQGERFCGFL